MDIFSRIPFLGKTKEKQKHVKFNTTASGIIGVHTSQDITQRAMRVIHDADLLKAESMRLKNVMVDKAQGNMFEYLETMKFNMSALKKDSNLYAQTTASMGLPTDPVDILIFDGKKVLREVQAKSCNRAAQTTIALSQKKYEEMLRLGPKDQHAAIERLLKKRIESGTLKAEEYEQTLRNFKKTLSHGEISSEGTSYNESLKSTDPKNAAKIANEFKTKSALTDMHKSGIQGGMIGGALGGATNLAKDIYDGDKEFGEILSGTVISSAKGFATGYTVTALSKGIQHSSSALLSSAAAESIIRSNAPVAIASGCVASAHSLVCYMKGDIDSDQLLDEVSHTAITGSAAFYYGALGQVAIPIPVVGSIIGAGVGYFIGNMLHQSGLIALGDSAVVKAAKERRKQVEAFCLASIEQTKRQRHELQNHLNKYFNDRKIIFEQSFDVLDHALINGNAEEVFAGLEQINGCFGSTLQFKTLEEFDMAMQSNQAIEF